MKTCSSCAFWRDLYYEGESQHHHVCDRVDNFGWPSDEATRFESMVEVNDNSGLTYYLVTGPDFGCVHHKETDKANNV